VVEAPRQHDRGPGPRASVQAVDNEAPDNRADHETTDVGTANDRTADNGAAHHGTADDCATDNGTADHRATNDCATDNIAAHDGTANDRATNDGTADDRPADDCAANDAATGGQSWQSQARWECRRTPERSAPGPDRRAGQQ